MMLRTLFAYFFRRQIAMILRITFGVLVIIMVVDFTEVSGRLPDDANISALGTLYLSLLRTPNILETAFPFIILFASMATLIALNRDYELVVARASGISAWQFLAPLSCASLLVGIVIVTVINPIAAHTLRLSEQQEIMAGMRNRDGDDGSRPPWLRQKTKDGTTIIGAKTVADDGLLLGNAVFIKIGKDDQVEERLDARIAHLEPGKWVLKRVRIFKAGKNEENREQVEIATRLKPEYVRESLSSPKTVSFYALPRKIEAARVFGVSSKPFAVQFHSLIALPLLLVSMTLIAAVVSLRFARFGQQVSVIVGGILAGFVLYVLSVLIKAFGGAGLIPPIAAAWIPVVIAMALGVTILLHKEDG